jgi:putative transposase
MFTQKIEMYTRSQTLKTVKKGDDLYNYIDNLAFKSKNIFNSALYLCRKHYFSTHQVMNYYDLYKKYQEECKKNNLWQSDCNSLPSQTVQQILKAVIRCMDSFKALSKNTKLNAKLPKYKDKVKGRYVLYFTNQQIKYKFNSNSGYIHFPKNINIPDLKTHLKGLNKSELSGFNPISEVRILPGNQCYKIELVYVKRKIITPEQQEIYAKNKNKNYASIDLGLNNFVTVVTYGTKTARPRIINGKGLKSYNRRFNYKLSKLKSAAKKRNNKYTTQNIANLCNARKNRCKDFYHKSAKEIINYLKENKVSVLAIGYNEGWKQNVKLAKQTKKDFIQIAYYTFIQILKYKCLEEYITVVETKEDYTSGTSFLDLEKPIKDYYNKSRRKKRGSFLHNNKNFKTYINADVNAAYQILSKASEFKIHYNPKYIKEDSLIPKRIDIDTFKDKKKGKQKGNKKRTLAAYQVL